MADDHRDDPGQRHPLRALRDAARRRCSRDTEGLESANANLMGQVMLAYDDERTTRDALLELMARGGFREQQFV